MQREKDNDSIVEDNLRKAKKRIKRQFIKSGRQESEFKNHYGRREYVVDVDSNPAKGEFGDEVSPCITPLRYKGLWLTKKKRRN